MDPRAEEKRRQLEQGLERGPTMIHLDARHPGVVVPAKFRQDFHLRLNLSYRYEPPDLTVGDWGVRETLSFGGSRFAVAVPWSAIFAITGPNQGDQAFLHPEDMPKELFEVAAKHFGLGDEVERLGEEAAKTIAQPPPSRGKKGNPFRVITGEPTERAEAPAAAPAPALASAPESPIARLLKQPLPVLASVHDLEQPPASDEPNKPDKPKRGHLTLIK